MSNDLLIYGCNYKLWRDEKYLGIATWVDDENIGEAFIQKNGDENLVFIADQWKLVSSEINHKDPHEVSNVKCDLCGKEWLAVRPEGIIKLECPNCHNNVNFENISI